MEQKNALTKTARKSLIKQISDASGVAQYALDRKMSDQDILEASKHLGAFQLLKSSNNYNRHRQGKNTQEQKAVAREEERKKLEQFLDVQNSEILTAGKWLLSAFSKKGSERKITLLERDLVHKDDYNHTVSEIRDVIEDMDALAKIGKTESKERIQALEWRIDKLRKQLGGIEDYIRRNYSVKEWNHITSLLNIKSQNENN